MTISIASMSDYNWTTEINIISRAIIKKILGRDCEVKKLMWFLKDIEIFKKIGK